MTGCSLLDAGQYVSAVCVKEDGSLRKRRWKFVLFSDYRMKNKFRSQD
ncbi:MAG: hypothetical protein RHS_4808 [Robinsoniella sp. RHS]|nr:MAG: hypothetical protein RHS_4808 [Robinsoniella sp. RHS]